MNIKKYFLLLMLLSNSFITHARIYSVSIDELNQYITKSINSSDPLAMLIGDKVQSRLDSVGFKLIDKTLVYSATSPAKVLKDGCWVKVTTGGLDYTVTLNSNSQFQLVLDALSKPIIATLDLYGTFDANGRVSIKYGIDTRIFGCWHVARDNVNLNVNADFILTTELTVNLNPRLVNNNGEMSIVINPTLNLDGGVTSLNNINVSITDFDTLAVIELIGFFFGGIEGALLIDSAYDRGLNRLISSSPGQADSIFKSMLKEREKFLYDDMAKALLSESEYLTWNTAWQNGVINPIEATYSIPNIDNTVVQRVGGIVNQIARSIPVAIEYIKLNKIDIVYYLLVGDSDRLQSLLASSAACEAAGYLLTGMPVAQAPANYQPTTLAQFCTVALDINHSKLGNAAVSVVGDYWTLSPGTRFDIGVVPLGNNYQPYMKQLNYKTINNVLERIDYDQVRADQDMRACLVDGMYNDIVINWADGLWDQIDYQKPYPPLGDRCVEETQSIIWKFYIDDVDQQVNQTAAMKHRLGCIVDQVFPNGYIYTGGGEPVASYNACKSYIDTRKTQNVYDIPIKRGNGTCQLEMRVYKKDPAATNLKPLLAIHGGSWKYRGAAFYGMEAQISQYTERGFVVFAPFYRLASEVDGNIECNRVTGNEVVSDVIDALKWVESHRAEYGASGLVRVVGQSAGAHLAAYLATHSPASIEKVLLFYPVVDFQDYIDQVMSGALLGDQGRSALEAYLGASIDKANTGPVSVADNSFPTIIQANPSAYPPMFILHGKKDNIIPSRQSVRMCNALSGSVNGNVAQDDGGDPASGTYRRIYLCDTRGSQLHLIAEGTHLLDACVKGVECYAGSDSSKMLVLDSITQALNWLSN